MKFNILKTRRGKLKLRLTEALKNTTTSEKNIEQLLIAVDEYEQNNLAAIAKLKKDKIATLAKINGALKQTIKAHGPITMILIGSASKRIYGSLIDNNKKESFITRLLRWK